MKGETKRQKPILLALRYLVRIASVSIFLSLATVMTQSLEAKETPTLSHCPHSEIEIFYCKTQNKRRVSLCLSTNKLRFILRGLAMSGPMSAIVPTETEESIAEASPHGSSVDLRFTTVVGTIELAIETNAFDEAPATLKGVFGADACVFTSEEWPTSYASILGKEKNVRLLGLVSLGLAKKLAQDANDPNR